MVNTKLTTEIEEYLEALAEKEYPRGDLTVGADLEPEENMITMFFSVKGGIDKYNTPWGGDETLDDYISCIDHPNINKVTYELDHEDLTGELFVEYSQ